MSATTEPTPESIAERVRHKMAHIRKQRAESVNDLDLAWLALVPVWTFPLATAADFNGGYERLQRFLDDAEALGLVVQQRPSESVSQRVAEALHRNLDHQFWMPDAERPRVLAELRDRLGPSALLREIHSIFRRMPASDSIPALEQWRELAGLATEAGVSRAAERLRDAVRELIERGETGAALGWLRTGALLAQALGGQFDSAVLRGRREVEVAYRRAHDRRALLGFLERDEQIRAFAELVEGPDELWALHFLGTGGAGKTMLIRHINAELAARHKCITARVDFDYISPNYPRLRPEQLLVELADELRAHSTPDDFARFEDRVRTLQDVMSKRAHDAAAGDPLDTPEFGSVLRAFADWLHGLPQRVVLILDTCEELAKFQPGGEMAPGIRATYRILKALHDGVPNLHSGVPSLRVIFAGRRPLALGGHEWKLKDAALPEGRRHLPAADNEYVRLRLHVVRGFTDGEADDYFKEQKVWPAVRLREEILEHSREKIPVAEWIEGAMADDERRTNPFDLSLYAAWLREKPDLTVEFIRQGGTDPYIDLRIARRLTGGLPELLPAVAFLGRFDEATLRIAARFSSDADFASDFQELSGLEWIDYQLEESGAFLQVDRNLHPRLLAYYKNQNEQRRLFEGARRQLAPGLARHVRERLDTIAPQRSAKSELGFDLVHAALRALEPEEAAELWEEIEARIIATGRWDWAGTIVARLLGALRGEDETGRVDAALEPGLLATQASVKLHSEFRPDVMLAWESVLAVADNARPVWRARALAERAWLGKIAASPHAAITPEDVARLNGLWEQYDGADVGVPGFERVAASLYAATETVVEGIEAGGKYELPVRSPASLLAEALSPELKAFAFTLCSRLHRSQARRAEAEEAARAAMACARTEAGQPPQRWAGWLAPDSIEDFAALEWLLTLRWFAESNGAAEGIRLLDTLSKKPLPDSERRCSLELELQLGERVPRPGDLDRLGQWDRYDGPRPSERAAHRAVAPLAVNLALAWLALGDSERALALLEARIQRAKALGPDPQMIAQCELAKLRVFSRMRLRRRGEPLMERSLQAPELAPIGWPARALNGLRLPELPRGEGKIPRELARAWLRSQIGDDPHSRHLAVAIESRLTFRGVPIRELVRRNLEYAGLHEDGSLPGRALVGRRRLAELDLEEGELIALRLPKDALTILDLAHENFVAVEDWVGALIAAICAATAAHRAGLGTLVTMGLSEKVQPAYARILGTGMWELPSWPELEALASGKSSDLRCLDHPVWGGWLHRLFRCLLAEQPGKINPQLAWLARHYGEDLPVELGFSDQEKKMALKARRSLLGSDRTIQTGLWASLCLLVFTIALSVTGLSTASSLLSLFAMAGYIFFFVVFLFAAMAQAITAWRVARCHLALTIEPADPADSPSVASSRPCHLRIQMNDPKSRADLRLPAVTPGLRRYSLAADDIPYDAVDLLVDTRRRLLGNAWWNRLAIPIATPAVLSAPAWEAALVLALPAQVQTRFSRFLEKGGRAAFLTIGAALLLMGGSLMYSGARELAALAIASGILFILPLLVSRRKAGSELHFYRGGARRWSDPQHAAAWKDQRIESDCSRKWRLLVEQGLAPFRKKKFWVSELHRSTSSGSRALLHAVGRAVDSTAGLALEIASEEALLEQTSENVAGGRRLLSSEDLSRREAALTILQGEPLTEQGARSPSDRESAALLRALGGELFAAGAQAVLVLPSLHAPLAEAVLRLIAGKLASSRPPSLRRMLEAVSLARTAIRDWPAAAKVDDLEWFRHDQLEAALDICLFARDDFPPPEFSGPRARSRFDGPPPAFENQPAK